jgi:hypothetical protein
VGEKLLTMKFPHLTFYLVPLTPKYWNCLLQQQILYPHDEFSVITSIMVKPITVACNFVVKDFVGIKLYCRKWKI